MANLAPPPKEFVDEHRELTKVSNAWLLTLTTQVSSSAAGMVGTATSLTNIGASVALTPLLPTAPQGTFRVSVYARVTTVAGVSSSIIPTITTTDGTIITTQSGAALTGNVTNAPASWVFIVACDASTPLSYSTTYASNPAGAMKHSLRFFVEQLF